MRRALVALLLACGLVASPLGAASGTPVAGEAAAVTVSISEVSLDGPAIVPVTVSVTNGGDQPMRKLGVTLAGPVGWSVFPDARTVKEALHPGRSVDVQFQIRVPEPRPGLRFHTFTAVATYGGGDGAGSATATRVQRTGDPLPNLAAAYNNVGVTDESNTAPGEFDSEGNSFSAQKLADVGIVPGGAVTALGATFTWPDVPAGEANNVAGGSAAIALTGQGSRIAFLGSGSSPSATGTVTVFYTDGTSTTATLGFPNWSFQDAGAHGATLVAASNGRNRPDGYGNAGVDYRIFANSVAIDPAKTVDVVVLPGNATVHVFDLAIVP